MLPSIVIHVQIKVGRTKFQISAPCLDWLHVVQIPSNSTYALRVDLDDLDHRMSKVAWLESNKVPTNHKQKYVNIAVNKPSTLDLIFLECLRSDVAWKS